MIYSLSQLLWKSLKLKKLRLRKGNLQRMIEHAPCSQDLLKFLEPSVGTLAMLVL